MNMIDTNGLHTFPKLAERLELSAQYIYKLAREGRLRYETISGVKFAREIDVDAARKATGKRKP